MTGNNPMLDLVNVDAHKKIVRFCQFVFNILSGNESLMSIKGRNSIKILRKIMGNNPKLDHVNVMCIQILVRFCQLVLKILSRNKSLMSIKGCNSVKFCEK